MVKIDAVKRIIDIITILNTESLRIKTLAEKIGTKSTSSVKRYIESLMKVGWVKKENNEYLLTDIGREIHNIIKK